MFMTASNLVEIVNLKKYYPIRRFGITKKVIRAVDGVSFSIKKGETLGLVGESGCGKSTTGRMIAQLVPSTEGKIFFKGENISKFAVKHAKQLSKKIQYVFQDPYTSLNPRHKIASLLKEPLTIHHIGNKKERRQSVLEMLEQIGLDPSFENKYIHQLSGGQRQRIVIARALMLRPEFLVLDEPVSALDVSVQAQILNLLKDLQQQFSLTYLFISHDLNVVHYMSDRVAVMYLGKIVEVSDVDHIYKAPLHPYTQTLVSAIPTVWKKEKRRRILLEGEIPEPSSTKGCSFQGRCPFAYDRCKFEQPKPIHLDNHRMVSCHLYS
ncbi:ABC transporter ATP-binding protein [Parageobacillus thermoglucosidasius]|uniref:ABC transporter ATP-binding protein n=1 Tax=Parageobacillus thermoglucosidasius TaxID=1426 RepID=UPI000554D120